MPLEGGKIGVQARINTRRRKVTNSETCTWVESETQRRCGKPAVEVIRIKRTGEVIDAACEEHLKALKSANRGIYEGNGE